MVTAIMGTIIMGITTIVTAEVGVGAMEWGWLWGWACWVMA
jgi:hypothetical protein